MKLLLSNGADLEKPTKDELTPLMLAAVKGNEAIVRMLIKRGSSAAAYATTTTGDTALSLAIQNGHDDVAELLEELSAKESKKRAKKSIHLEL